MLAHISTQQPPCAARKPNLLPADKLAAIPESSMFQILAEWESCPKACLRDFLFNCVSGRAASSLLRLKWSAVPGLHGEGGLGLWKGASSKKALHVILISDGRGLGHLCSTGEQNVRLPFRCQEMLSNGEIQRAQKAKRHLSSWAYL